MRNDITTHAVLKVSHSIRRAMIDNDAKTLKSHVADDYHGSDAGGRLHDRVGMLTAYGPGGVTLEEFSASEIETKDWAGTVLISGVGFIRGSYMDQDFEHRLRFLDVYAERGLDGN